MKLIPLTQDKFAKVDDEDFEWLSQWKWYYRHGYAVRTSYKKRTMIFMHREIMQTPDELETDHIDMNGLNNQRNNLRICTHNQNLYNQNKYKNNVSGYKGVHWNNGWRAKINVDKQTIHIGYFDSAEDAAHAYDDAAKKYHGEFAQLNFPEDR